MPIKAVVFYVVLLFALGYVARRGGSPERLVAFLFVTAAMASTLMPFDPEKTYHSVNWGVLAVDLLLFIALVAVAARADRFWPMWIAALQLIELAVHGVRAYDPQLWAIVYGRAVGELSYPMLLLLVIGAQRHTKRVWACGPELAWTPEKSGRSSGDRAASPTSSATRSDS